MSEIILPEPPPPPPDPPGPPGPPDSDRLFAWFVDGIDARWQRVEVELSAPTGGGRPDRLRLTLPDGSRLDWPLSDLRALRDQAGAKQSIVLRQDGRDPARLMLCGAEIVAHVRSVAPALDRRPPVENLGRLLKWSVAAVASVALIIFGLVPVLAAQLAMLLPPEGEKALGDATLRQIRVALNEAGATPLPACSSREGDAALLAMRGRLNAEGELPYPLQLHVLDHEMINAFALPGGHVVLFRGLIDAAQSPDEVAAVLAHEIGHVAHRDPTRGALRTAGSIGVLGLLLGDFAGGTVVLMMAQSLINASYSQAAEVKADDFAYGVLTRAEVNPAALGHFFERLREEYGDAEGIVAHFASHPTHEERIRAALEAEAAAGISATPVIPDSDWLALRRICGGTRSGVLEDVGREVGETPGGTAEAPRKGGKGRAGEAPADTGVAPTGNLDQSGSKKD
ncbi:M48 family metallopeptidase [Aliiroseovarius sp.]|uniref:M48 family metallopeptidase n=1 Tax=Aliiroseovarius sp. TaxID=1872442 RepID=UPI00262556CC|nr:M48 family metallopeptidase [Aliiroseovarius sp.]